MSQTSHLRSLQALDMALRTGSLREAAERLDITAAAVGQRIRALEDYLGNDLLLRGRSGLTPTPLLGGAAEDLKLAFDALARVAEALDFQRPGELHLVADEDWAELWLKPRLEGFRSQSPNLKFCINGEGEVPMRLGAPDLRILMGGDAGEVLYRDILVPVSGPDNPRRIVGADPAVAMEGMPLIHTRAQKESADHPGWAAWFAAFGHRISGLDRGVVSPSARAAMELVRLDTGFAVCGLSLVSHDLDAGHVVLLYPAAEHLPAPQPYRMRLRADAAARPHLLRFAGWLREEARASERRAQDLLR